MILVLATRVEGYSHVAQTVSEIGRAGSPAEVPWRSANLIVALCLAVFAQRLGHHARARGASGAPAVLLGCYAVSQAGMAVFASPHPLHNVFGLSMLLGYLAPLSLVLAWRRLPDAQGLRTGSLVGFGLVLVGIFLNLSPLFARELYPLQYYGAVQRALLLAFYGWCAFVSLRLYRGAPTPGGARAG
jgi:hypothetical protein